MDYPSLLPAGLPADPALLPTLLDLLPMGVIYYTPVLDADGVPADLALAYLNPAAQRMTHLPARPDTTYRQYFQNTDENGAWDFHRRSWSAQGPQHFEFYYEAPGYDDYFRVTAQRLGEGLLVVFTHTRNEIRSQTEQALRDSQRREQAARAEAERQQRLLRQVFEHAPVPLALFQGAGYVVELVNPALAALWGRPVAELVGRPVFEALPDLRDQGFEEILAGVLRTGEAFRAEEVPAVLAREHLGQPALGYFNISYEALPDPAGAPATTIIASAVEITSQVLARRQIERLNQEAEAARSEAELARAEAERQRGELERVFEQAPVAIAVYQGPTYTIQLANPTVARLWGRTREQLIGKGLFEALPEVAGLGYEQLLDGVMATGTPYVAHAMEAKHERDGRLDTVYWDFVYVPTYAADNTIDGAMVVATEVTEQVEARHRIEQLGREAEAARAAAERQRELLQALFEQAPVAIALFEGEEARIASVNPPMAALWGRTPAQVVGRPLLEAVPELQGQGFDDIIAEVYRSGIPYVGTEAPAHILRDGQLVYRYYDFSCQPIYDAQGGLLGVINVGTEVTAQVESRQQLEQLNQELEARVQARTRELQEQQSLLNRILGQVPAAIATLTGPGHRFAFANSFYRDLVGGREVVGQTVAAALPEVVEQGFIGLLDEVARTGTPFIGQATPVQLHDRATDRLRQYYLDFSYQPMPAETGHEPDILVFAVDVTSQVLAQQQVRALNGELAATNQELTDTNAQLTRTNADLDTFVYTASHDLKTPITNVEGLLLALRDTLPPAVQQQPLVADLLRMLNDTVARFRATITQLTDLVRLQQTLAGPAEPVPLAALVAEVQTDLAAETLAAQATVQVAVAPGLRVRFAPASLRSIVYNLLSNALKYRDPQRPARVQVQAEARPGAVVLRVQDNGLGLSGSQQQRLFQVFQRLHTHVEGTGVGLYMIKRLIENGGGTIAVSSEAGQGTTFTVRFPA